MDRPPPPSLTDHDVDGLVCRLKLAHKCMRTELEWPRILLLACPLEHALQEAQAEAGAEPAVAGAVGGASEAASGLSRGAKVFSRKDCASG